MESIRHQIEFTAPVDDVFRAVATREGVASWWSRDVRGTDGKGGRLEIWFGGDLPGATMELVDVTPPNRVVWNVIQGAKEWVGHDITFELRERDGKTVLNFTHEWDGPCDFMHHCSTSWGFYLLSLKALFDADADAGVPWPDSKTKPLEVLR